MEPKWIIEVRNVLLPAIGAFAYVILDEALRELSIQPKDMTLRQLSPFLHELKNLLPAGVDKDGLILEVANIMPGHLPAARLDRGIK